MWGWINMWCMTSNSLFFSRPTKTACSNTVPLLIYAMRSNIHFDFKHSLDSHTLASRLCRHYSPTLPTWNEALTTIQFRPRMRHAYINTIHHTFYHARLHTKTSPMNVNRACIRRLGTRCTLQYNSDLLHFAIDLWSFHSTINSDVFTLTIQLSLIPWSGDC